MELLPRLQLLGGPTLYQYVFAVHTSPKKNNIGHQAFSSVCSSDLNRTPRQKKKKSVSYANKNNPKAISGAES